MSDFAERSASLAPFFTPKGVAVIGASRDPSKLSYGVVRNLTDPERGYPGPVYPVNPKADEILGLRCYPDIASVPDPVELAVLIIPATAVLDAVEACGRRGIKAAVVISGGFREVGPEGAAREAEMVAIARRYGMRIMGPNGIGVIDTHTPLNTTFVKGMPPKGHIAFLSQSGALCGGIIDWTVGRGIGFSRFLSVGNEADVNETDLIPFLAADDASRVIALYLEDVKGGPAFVDALRAAAAVKPVLALKTGRTAGGQLATASHTGALAGAHAAFRAACLQTGVIEVEHIEVLFNAALALACQPLPAGNRIAIVTNAGGPAALAADALEPAGLRLARTGNETQALLRSFLPPDAQTAGPVDLLGGADEHGYRRAMDAVLADPACDGVLAILVPQALVNPVAVVEAFAAAARSQVQPVKPVLVCLMGEASLEEAFRVARAADLPAYTFPEDAVAAFGALWRRAKWLRRGESAMVASDAGTLAYAAADAVEDENGRYGLVRSLPVGLRAGASPEVRVFGAGTEAMALQMARARREVQTALLLARSAGRQALDAVEARPLLAAYGITTPREALATSPADAARFAAEIGFPVVLKLISPDILHKTDIGGVILDVQDEEAAAKGFEALVGRAAAAHPGARVRGVQVQQMIRGGQEVIVGVKRDPTFGPLIMFGLGGVYVEALRDVSFRLAPLTPLDAEEMIDEVRSARLLAGLRGAPPADRAALVDVIVRIGQLAADHPDIAELDINPLLVLPQGQGAVAVDARVILG
ncbi:MAG: acetate--CoA ligase family protein [Anaerolineae bacterium]|nr:acetate--CoA ligase family protein [Anaerolineae bacterium]